MTDKAAIYIRVSTEEQVEGYSLDAQRRAFQTLVQGRGWTAYREYLDEGKSAHNDDIRKRPKFQEAIDDARHESETGLSYLREALGAFRLEVAKSYASIPYLKEVERRLTEHLVRIENKLDGVVQRSGPGGAS